MADDQGLGDLAYSGSLPRGGARIGCSRDWTVRSAAIDRTMRKGRTPSDHFAVTAVLKR